jgi:hypothetical protein
MAVVHGAASRGRDRRAMSLHLLFPQISRCTTVVLISLTLATVPDILRAHCSMSLVIVFTATGCYLALSLPTPRRGEDYLLFFFTHTHKCS